MYAIHDQICEQEADDEKLEEGSQGEESQNLFL